MTAKAAATRASRTVPRGVVSFMANSDKRGECEERATTLRPTDPHRLAGSMLTLGPKIGNSPERPSLASERHVADFVRWREQLFVGPALCGYVAAIGRSWLGLRG